MAGGSSPSAVGNHPGAPERRAAGRPSTCPERRLHELAVVAVVGAIAAGLFLAGVGLLVLAASVARAQTPVRPQTEAGQGSPPTLGGVTVSAPTCRSPQDPASACAAERLDQAAKAAAQGAVQNPPAPGVPDAQSPPATIGLGTPAAAAQQPGTPYGKAPGYTPPPPAGASNTGPFTRTRP